MASAIRGWHLLFEALSSLMETIRRFSARLRKLPTCSHVSMSHLEAQCGLHERRLCVDFLKLLRPSGRKDGVAHLASVAMQNSTITLRLSTLGDARDGMCKPGLGATAPDVIAALFHPSQHSRAPIPGHGLLRAY